MVGEPGLGIPHGSLQHPRCPKNGAATVVFWAVWDARKSTIGASGQGHRVTLGGRHSWGDHDATQRGERDGADDPPARKMAPFAPVTTTCEARVSMSAQVDAAERELRQPNGVSVVSIRAQVIGHRNVEGERRSLPHRGIDPFVGAVTGSRPTPLDGDR